MSTALAPASDPPTPPPSTPEPAPGELVARERASRIARRERELTMVEARVRWKRDGGATVEDIQKSIGCKIGILEVLLELEGQGRVHRRGDRWVAGPGDGSPPSSTETAPTDPADHRPRVLAVVDDDRWMTRMELAASASGGGRELSLPDAMRLIGVLVAEGELEQESSGGRVRRRRHTPRDREECRESGGSRPAAGDGPAAGTSPRTPSARARLLPNPSPEPEGGAAGSAPVAAASLEGAAPASSSVPDDGAPVREIDGSGPVDVADESAGRETAPASVGADAEHPDESPAAPAGDTDATSSERATRDRFLELVEAEPGIFLREAARRLGVSRSRVDQLAHDLGCVKQHGAHSRAPVRFYPPPPEVERFDVPVVTQNRLVEAGLTTRAAIARSRERDLLTTHRLRRTDLRALERAGVTWQRPGESSPEPTAPPAATLGDEAPALRGAGSDTTERLEVQGAGGVLGPSSAAASPEGADPPPASGPSPVHRKPLTWLVTKREICATLDPETWHVRIEVDQPDGSIAVHVLTHDAARSLAHLLTRAAEDGERLLGPPTATEALADVRPLDEDLAERLRRLEEVHAAALDLVGSTSGLLARMGRLLDRVGVPPPPRGRGPGLAARGPRGVAARARPDEEG